ncbi:hypothetical protein HMPREF3217_00156 [Finegoldia magna]|nr:hypothetical protein HMPREF3217_00156 [Finegoldia magna]
MHFTLDIEKANDYFSFSSSDNIKEKMLQLFSLLPVGQKHRRSQAPFRVYNCALRNLREI